MSNQLSYYEHYDRCFTFDFGFGYQLKSVNNILRTVKMKEHPQIISEDLLLDVLLCSVMATIRYMK